MTTCEREIDVPVPPDLVLAYIGDPRNLERFVPGVRSADRTWSGGVDVLADVGGEERRMEATVARDPDRNRVDWSVEGPEGYGGHLNVLPSDRGTLVRAYVTSERLDPDRLADAVDTVLESLAHAVTREAVRGRTGEYLQPPPPAGRRQPG